MLYVGIDVGKDGGIVSISRDKYIYTKSGIPKVKGTTNVDYVKMYSILKQCRAWAGYSNDVIVCIEDVHSLYGMSAKSNFSFGHIKGIMEGMVVALGYEYHLVTPKNWQKVIWEPEDVVTKENGRKDTKATSLNAVKRIFPDVDFRKSSRARIFHDGIVDAALIAEYCRIVNQDK